MAFHSTQVLGSGPQIYFERTGVKLPKRGRASSVPYGAAFGPRAREPMLLVNKRATSGVLEFQGVSWHLIESRRRSIDSIPVRALAEAACQTQTSREKSTGREPTRTFFSSA